MKKDFEEELYKCKLRDSVGNLGYLHIAVDTKCEV
jgi:hypothetical protein